MAREYAWLTFGGPRSPPALRDPLHGMRGQVAGGALGAEAPSLRLHSVLREPGEGVVGDQDLARAGGLGEARRDVDVDAEVVAADLPGAAEVDAGPKPGAKAGALDLRRP